MVGVLDQLVQFDRLEFLFFVNRLFLNILNKFRSIVHGLDGEVRLGRSRCTGKVGHREGHRFSTVPIFIRNLDVCRTILVDVELQVLVTRNAPLEFCYIIIHIAYVVGKADGFKFILFFDSLVRNLLEDRSIVNRLHDKVCSLGIRGVFAIGRRELNLSGTVPVLVRNNDRSHAVRINLHIQVAVSLIFTNRRNVEFPKNLVFRMIGVGHVIIEFDFCESLAFINRLVRNLLDFGRVIHGFYAEVHRFGTHSTLGVSCNKGDVFGTVPVLVRNFNRRNAVGRN